MKLEYISEIENETQVMKEKHETNNSVKKKIFKIYEEKLIKV